ncbi:MAG: hypothetical protein H0X24_09875 [Ktedonobacterales bacterium]|nr:hypothetical protein [Ktedonobacterales bacterium]
MKLACADANSYYCSCEIAFRRDLVGKPVVVGNNDGCVVSRTPAAKPFIPMAVPIHQYQRQVREQGITVFSSNYALYHQFAVRMHAIMGRYAPTEEFAVDEAFLDLGHLAPGECLTAMRDLRTTLLREINIPVTIGVAPTKVLSKLATSVGKTTAEGCYAFANEAQIDQVLAATALEDIWYIAGQRAKKLRALGIENGLMLKQSDIARMRRLMTLPVAHVVAELRGISAIPLRTVAPPRKESMCARAFGHRINDLREM